MLLSISNKGQMQRLMLLNLEIEFMDSLAYGYDHLWSEFNFSQTSRVERLIQLLRSPTIRKCILVDNL